MAFSKFIAKILKKYFTFYLACFEMSRDARATFLDEIREQKQTIENLKHSLDTAEHESRERALNIIVAIRNRFPQPVLVKYNRMNWPLDVVSHAIELLSWCGKPKIRKQLGSSFFAPHTNTRFLHDKATTILISLPFTFDIAMTIAIKCKRN